MNELPAELKAHINQFLAPQDLAALEQTHQKIPDQYESAVYGAIIRRLGKEIFFSFSKSIQTIVKKR